jgi:5-formyltetrahydrofolate cyclo-ligase
LKNGGPNSQKPASAIRSHQFDLKLQRPCRQEMQNTIRQAKQTLRNQVNLGLKRLGPGERAAASAQARTLLSVQALWQSAQSVLFFAPLPEELDVWPLLVEALAAGKKVGLPRFVAEDGIYEACQIQDPKSDLRVGHFGIREPASCCAPLPSTRLDLILVPGVAFDLHGRRLGRGKGYYDQLLGELRGTTCGVAFDEQIVNEIPVASHDVNLDCVLTPTRWVDLRP